jgi:hypothetical protein
VVSAAPTHTIVWCWMEIWRVLMKRSVRLSNFRKRSVTYRLRAEYKGFWRYILTHWVSGLCLPSGILNTRKQ